MYPHLVCTVGSFCHCDQSRPNRNGSEQFVNYPRIPVRGRRAAASKAHDISSRHTCVSYIDMLVNTYVECRYVIFYNDYYDTPWETRP